MKRGVLTVDAPQLTSLTSKAKQFCLFRYLVVQKFIIKNSSISQALQLNGMALDELDIRGTQIKSLSAINNLPHINKLIVREGQLPDKTKDSWHYKIEVR